MDILFSWKEDSLQKYYKYIVADPCLTFQPTCSLRPLKARKTSNIIELGFQPTPSRDGHWSCKRLNPNLNWLPETNFVNLENVALETVTTGGLTIPEKAQT